MITKEQALVANHFEHKTLKNADGTRLRARRNGVTRTFKTRPLDFKVPFKHGLYIYGHITQINAHEWDMVD